MASLRSIRLKGFKTFARATEIVVEPGITVIIGPNGSGKSNIADAVLWALGEQSPTAIRGRSMQDVIFSGTDGRRGAAAAEVTLQFDNAGGAFPVEYDEVEISRAVTREGASTYRINGAAVRLTDVQELISAVGLGREMHSVISQGKVEEFLTSTPLTRRALVEEASGLGRYKKRRRRAQSKLQKVQANLDRVLDVEAEVKKALRPLKQQVTAAERHAEAAEALAEGRARLVLAERGQVAAERTRRAEALEEVRAARAEREGELELIRRARSREEEAFAESMRRREDLSRRYHDLRGEAERLRSRSDAIEQRLERMRADLERTRRRRQMAEDDVASARDRLSRVVNAPGAGRRRMATVEEAAARLDAAIAELHPRRSDLEEEAENLRLEAFEIESTRSRLAQERSLMEKELDDRRARRAGLEELQQEAAARGDSARGSLERLREEHAEAGERRAEADRLAAEAEGAAEDLRRELLEAVEAERDVREQLAELEARGRILEGIVGRREGLSEPARGLLERMGGARLLIETLRVADGYERCVAAVLGPLANALVLPGERDVGVLTGTDGPLELVWPEEAPQGVRAEDSAAAAGGPPSLGAGGEAGASGARSLWEVVDGPPEVLAALRRLLPEVLVLEVEDGAQIPSDDRVVVLRSGELLSGDVHAARRVEPAAEAFLGARAGLEELTVEKAVLVDRRGALEERVSTLRASSEQAAQRASAATAGALEAARTVSELEHEIEVCGRRVAQASTDEENAAERLSHDADLVRSLEEDLAAITESLEQQGRSLEEARTSLRRGRSEVEKLAERLSALEEKRSQASLLEARLKERLRAHDIERERTEESLKRAEGLQAALAGREVRLTEAIPAVEGLHSVVGRLADALERQVAVFRQDFDRTRQSSDEFAGRLRDHGQRESQLQQELAGLGERVVELQVALTHLEDRAADLDEQFEALCRRHQSPRGLDADGVAGADVEVLRSEVERLERRVERIGPINPLAEQEYRETAERAEFLAEQRRDLEAGLAEIGRIIQELDEHIERTFADVFAKTKGHFQEMVEVLFPGGKGVLRLVDVDTLDETTADSEQGEEDAGEDDGAEGETAEPAYARQGVVVEIKPPRKAPRSMSLLSGGEKALAAIAFLFSLFLASPSAFYILDEVEAALDDTNIGRFLTLVRRYQEHTQFVIITHQRRTMEVADTLYGVAMDDDGTSRVLSRRLRSAGAGGSST